MSNRTNQAVGTSNSYEKSYSWLKTQAVGVKLRVFFKTTALRQRK